MNDAEAANQPLTPSKATKRTFGRKRLFQKMALAAASFTIFVGVCEFILRLNGYGNLEIYDPDPALYWKLKPNQNCYTKVDHKPVHINSLGTRGPEFQIEKPAGVFRVLSLGDSRTFGWGLAEPETYSARLQQALGDKPGAGRRAEVINAGVNAWSYQQMLVYFRETGLRYKPDVVVLAEANLWTQFSEKNSPKFVRQFLWRVRLKNLLRRSAIYHYAIELKLKSFYEKHRTRFIPVDPSQDEMFKEQQQKDPNALFRAAIEGVCELALSNGVKPVLLYLPTADDLAATNVPTVLEIKRGVSAKLSVPLVDLTGALRPQGKELYLEGDSVHLNAQGNEVVARKLFETVQALPGK